MKKHRVVIAAGCVLLVVLIVVVIIFIKSSKKKDVPQTVTMQTKELQKRTIMNTLSITGTVESATSKTVTFAMTDAEVETINVKIGDYVKKGDIICVFDSSDLEEDLADARTNLNVGQAKTANELESAEEALENTKTSSEISQTRAAQSTAEASGTYSEAQQKADDAYAAYETAEKKVTSLKNKVTEYKNNLKAAKTELTNLKNSLAEAIDETEKSSIQKEIESKSAEVTSINKSYETAQTNYAAAQKTAEEKKSAYEEAKKEADSAKSSYKKATQEQEDTVRNAEESISDQEKNLENSRLNAITANSNEEDQVESLKEQIESCTIVAPVDGVVTALNVEAGEKFAGGDVVTVQDDTSFVVSATVDEYDIADVAKGMRVIVKTDATGEEELDGEITFVSPTPSTSSEGMGSSESTSGYPVEIKLNSTNERLRIGMTAKASIVLEERTDVFAVPYDAITTNEAGESVIYVIDEDTTGTTGSKGGMPTGEGGRRGAGRPDGTVSGNGAGKGGRGGFGSGIDNENAEGSNASQEAGSQNVEGEMPQRPDMEGKMPQKTEIEGEMPQGSEGNTNQDVATQTRKTRAIVVTVGLESDYYTEVSSDELVEGMKVVLSTESTKESSNKEKNNTDMGSLFGGMGGSNTGGNSGGRPSGGGQRPGGF